MAANRAVGELGIIEGQQDIRVQEGMWLLDDDDFALIAQLQDPICCAELLFEDPLNKDYSGCYKVRDYQYPLFRPRRQYNIRPCARDVGKSFEVHEPVLTPSGWRSIGALQVGDEVIGGDGRATEVVGVYPQGERMLYDVEFNDGTVICADGDHLWSVNCDSRIARGRAPVLVTTTEVREALERPGPGHHYGGPRNKWKTPLMAGPAEFGAQRNALPIDPYLLGVLLGDGGLSRPHVGLSTPDGEELFPLLEPVIGDLEIVHREDYDYHIVSRTGSNWLRRVLDDLGLRCTSPDKHVPDAYLWAPPEDRLALLSGLVDTDGTVTHTGGVEVAFSSERLARAARHLALSLGGRASLGQGEAWLDGRQHLDRYRVVFRLPQALVPARLSRRRERLGSKIDTLTRPIVDVRPAGRGEAVCIKVAAPDGLFVARDFVVTHNTESIKARAVCHAFRRLGEDMLLTAPQLIHLEPLTQAIEARINEVRLTRDFLKRDSQKTGFTHKPFQCDFADGTRIIGRIPHITGTGVKGQHVPDLIGDEMQDYPQAGWTEVFPTVMKDHTGPDGEYDFSMTFYGVHAAGQGGKFGELAKSASYDIATITRLQTPNWSRQEKDATGAMYGGTNSPDYRRNVLGEPGLTLSQFFVTARLFACIDQDKESRYNTAVFKDQQLHAEEVDKLLGADSDVGDLLELPDRLGQQVYGGMDIGLVTDPTVIQLWAVLPDSQKRSRLQLVRQFHLWRFREKQIRQATYRIARQYGLTLRAFGQDITGLGLPLYQAMEDDEECPTHLKEVSHGYVFNAKVPVAVDRNYVSEQGDKLVDQYGHIVEVVRDKWTGQESLIARMTMIEASTRYLRGFIDSGFALLPFHDKLIADYQGETEQRVKAMAGVRKKPSAFHMLDASRAMAMAYKQGEMEEMVYARPHQPVLDRAVMLA